MNKLPSSDLKISIKSFPLSSFKTLSHFLFDKSNSDLKSAKRIWSIFLSLMMEVYSSNLFNLNLSIKLINFSAYLGSVAYPAALRPSAHDS